MSKDYKDILKRAVEAPFGQAETILKREGCWDDHGDTDAEPRRWRVRVYGEMQVQAVVTVEARTKDEAEELACDKASDRMFEWRDYGDTDVIHSEIEE
jgi:hypothetical protein